MGIDLLSDRKKVHKLILFYKIVHGLAPKYLQDLLILCELPQNDHSLRLRLSKTSFKGL